MLKSSLVVAAAVSGLALAGCSSGSEDSPDKPSTSTSAKPSAPATTTTAPDNTATAAKKTVEDYYARYFDGDGNGACELLTPKFQKEQVDDSNSLGGKAAVDCASAIKAGLAAAKTFGIADDSTQFSNEKVSGETATVLALSEEPYDDILYRLIWNGSQWLIDSEETADAS